MLCEQNESKDKRTFIRRYHEEYIEYGFVEYGSDEKKPQAICVICNTIFGNASLRFQRLRKHLHTWHPEIKHKDGIFFAGYMDENQYVSDEENIRIETDPQPSYVQQTFNPLQNVVCQYSLKRPYPAESLAESKVPKPDDVVCDIYSTYVAEKLQEAPMLQRFLAERLINEILFFARLGKLTEFHSVTCNNISYRVTDEKKQRSKKSSEDKNHSGVQQKSVNVKKSVVNHIIPESGMIDTATATSVKPKIKKQKTGEDPSLKGNTIQKNVIVNEQPVCLQKGIDDSNYVIISGLRVNINNIVPHTATTVQVEKMTAEEAEAEITIKEEPIMVQEEPIIVKEEYLIEKKHPIMVKEEPILVKLEPTIVKNEPIEDDRKGDFV